jgi:hypothetical protein
MNSPAREWMDRSAEIFAQVLEAAADADLSQPSVLPGWSRKRAAEIELEPE